MGLRDRFQELAPQSKPLFVVIYAAVMIGIALSAFYVFSAFYSPHGSAVPSAVTWLSSPPLSDLDSRISPPEQVANTSVDTIDVNEASHRPSKPVWVGPPGDSKMPPLEKFRLTKELVEERAENNVIIVTFGNYAFMDFILTWVKHLTDLRLSNLLVGAMDTKLLEALYWKVIPVFDMESHMSTIDVGRWSPTFHKMGREKVILIDAILPFGVELLMCDTDMVWLKPPSKDKSLNEFK